MLYSRTKIEFLNQRAMTDHLFVPNLRKPHKDMEGSILCTLCEVQ